MEDFALNDATSDVAATEPVAPPVETPPAVEPATPPKSLDDSVRAALDKVKERARDEQGRFTPEDKAAQKPQEAQKPAQAPNVQPQPQGQPAPVQAPAKGQAPGSWAPEAKAAFAALPPAVQAAVAKREDEVARGFEEYRGRMKAYEGLEQFQPYMERAGTTHAEVMKRAIEWERSLIQDPIGTVRHVAALTRLDPRLLAQALMNPQAPAPQRQAPQPQQPQLSMADIENRIRQEFAQREINSDVSRFIADPQFPHVEALADDMTLFIESGRAEGLNDAYQMALRLHPELVPAAPSASVANQQQAAVQARRAAKAVTGAPAAGVSPGGPRANPKNLDEAVRAAYEQHRHGSV